MRNATTKLLVSRLGILAVSALVVTALSTGPMVAQLNDYGQFLAGTLPDSHAVWAGNPSGREMFVLQIAYDWDGDLDRSYGRSGECAVSGNTCLFDAACDPGTCSISGTPCHVVEDCPIYPVGTCQGSPGTPCQSDWDCGSPGVCLRDSCDGAEDCADVDNVDGGCRAAVLPPHGHSLDLFDPSEDPGFGSADDSRFHQEIIAVPTDTGEYDRRGQTLLGVVVREGQNRRIQALRPGFFRLPTGADRTAVISCACSQLTYWGQPLTLLEKAGIVCP